MSGAPTPRAGALDVSRQARDLLRRVRESRWPGFDAPLTAPAVPAGPARKPAFTPKAAAPKVPVPSGKRTDEPRFTPTARPPATQQASAAAPGWASLDEVAAAVAVCTTCPLHATRRSTVPGEGNPRARLLFVGEAPGAEEDAQGRPFVGKAGQLLDKMIAAMGLARGEVYIANVLKCRPPGNRDPQPNEVQACLPHLLAQIDLIRPEAICALGRHSAHALLGTAGSLGGLRERFHNLRGIPLLATYHPSYLLRNPGEKTKAWKDLQLLMQRLGLALPAQHPDPGVGR